MIKESDLYKNLLLICALFGGVRLHAAEEIAHAGIKAIAGKALEGLVTVGPYVSGALRACEIGQEIRKQVYPTEEEKIHAEEVAEQYEFITTENAFHDCMIDNRASTNRNSSGLPTVCEEITNMFKMLGGEKEVNRITTIYNQYREQQQKDTL